MKRIYLVLTVVFFLVFIQCSKSPKKELIPDSDFGAYISAFTSGTISVESPIVVKLTVPVKQERKTGAEVQKTLFDFEPSINGKTVWIDNSTIQFIPEAAMKGGTLYYAKFRLGDIISTGKKMEKFSFSFSTIKQSFEITHEGLKTYSGTDFSYMFYKGSVFTADVISPEKIEAVINAKFENNKNQITWSHDPGQLKHFFRVDSLKRDNAASKKMVVEWDGKSIGSNAKGNKTFTIPALNDFKVIDASVEHSPQLCVAITFSDPLNSAQNLNGLITLEGFENLKFSIDQNLLKVWPGEELSGQRKLTVFQGIENAMNYSLKQDQSFLMVFENIKPEIKLIGNGVIVPQDGQLSMPFEAVSLKTIDLRIIQVYTQNMFRFLQDNNYDGSNELKKVGRLVYSGKVDLKPDNAAGFYKWNTYKINIGDYVELEQGPFYRVEMRFKKAYSLYGCEESEPDIEFSEEEEKLAFEADQKTWDSPGWYDDYYYP